MRALRCRRSSSAPPPRRSREDEGVVCARLSRFTPRKATCVKLDAHTLSCRPMRDALRLARRLALTAVATATAYYIVRRLQEAWTDDEEDAELSCPAPAAGRPSVSHSEPRTPARQRSPSSIDRGVRSCSGTASSETPDWLRESAALVGLSTRPRGASGWSSTPVSGRSTARGMRRAGMTVQAAVRIQSFWRQRLEATPPDATHARLTRLDGSPARIDLDVSLN
eukprot:645680-Prymnesium_polylepis.1